MVGHSVNAADLVSYDHSAAGHDGVLSDASGALLIKPCTAAEVAFYESLSAHAEFASIVPTFMGTLSMSSAEEKQAIQQQDPSSINAALQAAEGTAENVAANVPGPSHGKKLETGQAMVLQNISAGYVKPNILDVKLGARLWDDAAPPNKRARLDKVSAESTSGSLGFRIAGMRVWQPRLEGAEVDKAGEYKVYDKMYGRQLDEKNVQDGFRAFFLSSSEHEKSILTPEREIVLGRCLGMVDHMQSVLEGTESRMYSASILFVFEGDEETLKMNLAREKEMPKKVLTEDVDQDEDGDEEDPPAICDAKMIDFAHADWTPGEGPDENMLRGVRNVKDILTGLLA